MTQTRILLATTGYPPEYSGSGGRLHQQYQRLAQRQPGLSWRVVTKSAGGAGGTKSAGGAGAEHPVGPESIEDFSASRKGGKQVGVGAILGEIRWMRGLIRAGLLDDVSIVHSAGWSWFSLILCLAARRRNIPVLRELTSVGDTGAFGGVGRFLIQATNRLAQRFVAISPELEQRLRQTGITKPVWVRPNGIDVDQFRPPSAAERLSARNAVSLLFADFGAEDRLILHVGRIRPLKNQQFLVQCLKFLPDSYKLLLIGPAYSPTDSYYTDLLAALDQVGAAGRAVVVEGFCPDVRPYYRAADVFAFPSTNEGLGNVMLEALCCGVPVAAHRIAGVTDWIIDPGVNGALSPLECEDFANALQQAADLSTNAATIAEASRRRFGQDQFDEEFLKQIVINLNHRR